MADILFGTREGTYLKMLVSTLLLVLLMAVIGAGLYFGVLETPAMIFAMFVVLMPLSLRIGQLMFPTVDSSASKAEPHA
jgi:hypothetical protein